jgi:hypothetical protein
VPVSEPYALPAQPEKKEPLKAKLIVDANKSQILQNGQAEYTLTWTYQNTGT